MNRNKNAKNPSRKTGNQKQNSRRSAPKSKRREDGRPRMGYGGGSSLSLNAIQTTYVNPNKYWDIRPASSPGGMIIKAREPYGSLTVTATGAFTLTNVAGATQLTISPNNSAFPRLSTISAAYEHYKFKSFRLDFMSSQPTTASGQVLMWVDYVSVGTAATTSSEALSNITAVIANIYSSTSCLGTGNLSRLPRYVIDFTADANFEQSIQANAYVAVQGFTGTNVTVGELMVEYEIELFTPSQLVGTVPLPRLRSMALRGGHIVLSKDEVALAKQALWNVHKRCDSEECHSCASHLIKCLNNGPPMVSITSREPEPEKSTASDKTQRAPGTVDPDCQLYRNTVNEKSSQQPSRRSFDL